MTQKLHLRIDIASGQARMLRAIPNHYPAICAHRRDDVRVLRLIPSLVDLALMVNLLDNVELDLHLRLLRASTIASDLPFLVIVVVRVRNIGIGKLHMGNLKIIGSFSGSMRANQEAMGGIWLVGDSEERLVRKGSQ